MFLIRGQEMISDQHLPEKHEKLGTYSQQHIGGLDFASAMAADINLTISSWAAAIASNQHRDLQASSG